MGFTTNHSLLARVKNGDEVSWREFYETYKPLIFWYGTNKGLTVAENDDLLQNVMSEIFKCKVIERLDNNEMYYKYDGKIGRFRLYLRKIIINHIYRIYKKRIDSSQAPIVLSPELPDTSIDELDDAWEGMWKAHEYNQALIELKARVGVKTYGEFEMYAIQERPAKEVAKFYEVSISAVYVAKTRCIAELKKITARLQEK